MHNHGLRWGLVNFAHIGLELLFSISPPPLNPGLLALAPVPSLDFERICKDLGAERPWAPGLQGQAGCKNIKVFPFK
jgi:hypothetical protein